MGMITRENFYRPPEVHREPYPLPAKVYNLGRLLVMRTDSGRLYVPIASMRYLAVLDEGEWLFVERLGMHTIEAAWQGFKPQQRTSLQAPVWCDKVFYVKKSPRFMQRLQAEFLKEIQSIAGGNPATGRAEVIVLPTRQAP